MGDARQHVHDLIDRLAPAQLAAVAGLLEGMVGSDPVAEAVRVAPSDDEPVTEEDRRRFLEGQTWFAQRGKGIPMEDILAEFGLKPEDFPRGR